MDFARNFFRNVPWRQIAGPFLRGAARLGFSAPFSIVLTSAIRELASGSEAGAQRTTILALNHLRFRSDLEILAESGAFRVLWLPFTWQRRILFTFYPENTDRFDIYCPKPNSFHAKRQALLRRVLVNAMRRVIEKHQISAVLGAALHFKEDLDFGVAAESLGIPYIVLHRECFLASPAYVKGTTQYYRRLGPFAGSLLIVHNEHAGRVFVNSATVSRDRLACLGVLRMDSYVRRLNVVAQARRAPAAKKLVTFFSFFEGYGQWDSMPVWSRDGKEGFVQLFIQAHASFARLAARTHGVAFIIKPKWGGGDWIARIHQGLAAEGIDADSIPNLTIVADADAQSLIIESDVIVTFGSTVQLEAAIAGKPIVVPRFAEAADGAYADWIVLRDYDHLFDIASTRAEFESLILDRLENWVASESLMRERRVAFEDWVSCLDGRATERYVAAIEDTIARHRGGAEPQRTPLVEGVADQLAS